MHLFADSSPDSSFSFTLFVVIMILGLWQWCKWFRSSSVLRGAAKKGVTSLLGRMFK